MTWAIYISNFGGVNPTVRQLETKEAKPLSMGTAGEVRKKIEAVWPDVEWSNGFHELLKRENCSILFDLYQKDDEEIDNISMRLNWLPGHDPYSPIVELCEKYGWSIYDTETGEFWELPNPSKEGIRLVRERAAKILGKDSYET